MNFATRSMRNRTELMFQVESLSCMMPMNQRNRHVPRKRGIQ
jgi:hypothetical protein